MGKIPITTYSELSKRVIFAYLLKDIVRFKTLLSTCGFVVNDVGGIMAKVAAVILAAGQSTRLKSKRSKVLHSLAGRPVVSYPMAAAKAAGVKELFVVRGPTQEDLKAYLKECGVCEVVQKEPRGTANAVQVVQGALSSFSGYVLVLCGDAPLVRAEMLREFIRAVEAKKAKIGVVTMKLLDPKGYGRIVRDLDGQMVRIVEERDAQGDERSINEVNSGIVCAERPWLFSALKDVKSDNAKSEFYLTDLVRAAVAEGQQTLAFLADPPEDFLGINTRVELAEAARLMRYRINRQHMLAGVGILDDLHTCVDADVKIGQDTTIMPFTFLLGKTKIGSDCIIENGVVLRDAVVGDGVHIKAYSVIEDSSLANDAIIGPFARIRPSSRVGRGARVGNFVELKKCNLKAKAKANHLTYLGDATVGEAANIGCGTITCNYDGRAKHRTIIGDGAFVGSDVQFIAPVKIGSGCVIGAGSTITKDVPADALSLSRPEQKVVKGWAKRRRGVF